MKNLLLRLLTALFAGIMFLGLSGTLFLVNVNEAAKKDKLSAEPTDEREKIRDVRGNRRGKIRNPGQGQDKSPDDVRGPDSIGIAMVFTDDNL